MDDLEIAQKIIANSYNNINKNIYHDTSFIFPTTNEKINLYQKYLNSRDDILSVIASGDQILNSILGGSKNIDGFDISRFPRYYMELKKAGILSLNREEYINFFFDVDFHNDELYDDMYDKMRINLDLEYRKFWDGLLDFYDWSQIYSSTLFSSQTVNIDAILKNNDYLKNDKFKELKDKITKINIKYYNTDIANFNQIKKYDLINLSSIIYYLKDYSKILQSLKLKEQGVIITYLYNTDLIYPIGYIDKFKDEKEGILIYKK